MRVLGAVPKRANQPGTQKPEATHSPHQADIPTGGGRRARHSGRGVVVEGKTYSTPGGRVKTRHPSVAYLAEFVNSPAPTLRGPGAKHEGIPRLPHIATFEVARVADGASFGNWRHINDNRGRLYAWIPSRELKSSAKPPEDGLQGFAFARFNAATTKWEWVGAHVPAKSAKMLMYESGADEATHTNIQCNFDRMDILQCVSSSSTKSSTMRGRATTARPSVPPNRLIELPMNPFDEHHTPEHIGKATSEIMKVCIYEDGTPFVAQSGSAYLGKDFDTGKWGEVLHDLPNSKRRQKAIFTDKLGVTIIDRHRQWIFKDFEQNEDTRIPLDLGATV